MNREMLMLVDAISREKSVELDVVFDAVEAALASATKSRAVNAAAEKDPELKKLLDGAVRQAKTDTQVAAEGVKTFEALGAAALQELEVLAKRLG